MGIDRVLLEAMGVHARAAAAAGQLAVSELAVSESRCRRRTAATSCPPGRMGRCGIASSRGGPGRRALCGLARPLLDSSAGQSSRQACGSPEARRRALYRGSTDPRARSGRAVVSAHPAPRPATGPAAVPCGPRRTAGRRRGSDGHRFAIRRCRRPAPRLEGGVPLALSRSPAEDGAYGPLLGQGRRGREASPPSGEAPCARTGPSTRGDAAEGECRGPASTSIGRRRRGP